MSERNGQSFVYVLPSHGEDLCKIGFTRDPLARFRMFHPRFYDHFDLAGGLLIEAGRVRDARRIERLFIERWSDHRASAPTVVNQAAGGHTEWFRGIEAALPDFALRTATRYGYAIHTPLQRWLQGRLAENTDALYQWSSHALEIIRMQASYAPDQHGSPPQATLCVMLDMYAALGFQLETLLPPEVFQWYALRQRSSFESSFL